MVDCCIGLDEVFVVFGIQVVMFQCRDNFGSYCFVQIKWVINCYGVIIYVQCIRIRYFNCGQVFWVLDLDQCDIRVWIFVNYFCVEFMVIVQLNFNDCCVINNVVVGDDIVFIGINDDVGIQCYEFLLLVVIIIVLVILVEWRVLEWRIFLVEWRIIIEELLEIMWYMWCINGCVIFYVNVDY